MGKLVGVLIGMLFGPLGIIFGFILGALFDLRIKFSTGGFFSTKFGQDNIFKDSFPVLAASITIAGGVQKTTVLTVKNIITQLFGAQNAVFMMDEYKNFVENGFSPFLLQKACDNILYNIDYRSKIYIISTLFTILKAKGDFNSQEIYAVQDISQNIGISGYEFENMLNHFKNDGYKSEEYAQYTIHKSDPYEILGLNNNVENEEIKKQYRTLCKKYHPDLTSRLPEHQKQQTDIKMRQIINAYERIKKERGFR